MSKLRSFRRGRGRRVWMVGATLVAAVAFGVVFIASSGAAPPPSCPTPGNFEIDGNMTQHDCATPEDDWNTPSIGVQSTTQSGTYSTSGKDKGDPSFWSSSGSTPDKTDFAQAYATSRVVGGHFFVFVAWERSATSGTQGYAIEIDNSGASVAGDGTPQPNRGQGGNVFYVSSQGSSPPSFDGACTFSSQSTYGKTCTSSSAQAGITIATNTAPMGDPLNGTTQQAGGFYEVALDITQLTGIAPSCPGPSAASVYLRSITGQTSNGNLKGYVEPLSVAPDSTCVPPPISTTAQPGGSSAAIGSSQHDDVTVSDGTNPGVGSVEFFLCSPAQVTANGGDCSASGTQVGTAVTLDASGKGSSASIDGTTTPNDDTPGTYCWRAEFTPGSGDHHYLAGSHTNNGSECFTVVKNSPTILTTPSPKTVTLPGSATLKDSAVLSGGFDPTGTITFTLVYNGSTVDTETVSVSGNGTYSTPTGYALPGAGTVTGTYQWNATYSGDSNNKPASENNDVSERTAVSPASPSVVTTASGPVTLPGDVTFTDSAVVSGGYAPTGTLTFTLSGPNGFSYTQQVTVAGNGTYKASDGPLSNPAAGIYTWSVNYAGDSNNDAATDQGGPAEQTVVSPASPGIVTSQDPGAGGLGLTYRDRAILSGGSRPTGTITFDLYDNPNCTGAVLYQENVSVGNGNGTYETANGVQLNDAGTYYWVATYGGDANNQANATGCADEPVDVAPNQPSIVTTPSPSSVTLGTSAVTLNDSAVLSGGSKPTGSITFTLVYKGTTVDTETALVANGNGTYSTPTGYTLPKDGSTVTGSYQWNASYSGDANNGKASESNDPLEQVIVKPASPSVVTTASGPVTLPGDVTFGDSAVVSGGYDPQGTLTFTLSGPNGFSYSQQVAVSGNGTYKASDGPVSNPAAGTYTWFVSYAGDDNNDTATDQGGPAEQTVVSPASPGITTTQDPAAGSIGDTYKDKAILTGGSNPTGTITFDLYHNPNCTGPALHEEDVPVGNGNGTYETANGMQLNDAGTYYWVATYNGDADNRAIATGCSDEPVSVTPNQPAVSTTQDPASGSVGDTYNDKASLTGGAAPTGTITFDLYDNPSCTGQPLYQEDVPVGNGNGTYETANGVQLNSAGTYYWVATYHGDANNKSALSGCADEPVAVNPAAIHILKTADHAQVNAGEPVGFTMTLWNDGTGDAKGATLADVLPTNPGLSWKIDGTGSGFSSCSIASGSLACDPVTVPAGTDKATSIYWVHISSDTTAATGGDCDDTGLVDNTGKVTTSNAGSDQSSASTCVAEPAIHIVKTADKPQVNVGDPIGFTMTVDNDGNGDAHGVTLKDTLPTNSGLSWSVDKQGAGFGSSCSIASGVLTCGPVTVPAGTTQASSTFTVHVTSATTAATGGDCPSTGVVDNTALVTTTNDGGDQSSASTCVQALVDLAVTKSGSPATQVLGGGNITWTVVVTNSGPDADTGVKIADPMPAGNTFVSAASSQGSCTGGAILNCTIGTMAAGAKVTITLVTTPTTVGNQVNTVNVVGDRPETNTANNTATATVATTPQVFPPPKVFCVAVSKVNPKQLFVGRKTRLTIRVTQHGKAVKGVDVRIKGPKIDVHTKASNRKGVITRKIELRKAGILIFSPIASKRCNTRRVGVTNVFTPPVTG